MMTRMTSFLIRLSVDMVSKLDLFILYIALNLLRLGVQLVASGLSQNGGSKIENEALLVLRHFLHISYSHIHAFCPFIALYSPLIFLQQLASGIFD